MKNRIRLLCSMVLFSFLSTAQSPVPDSLWQKVEAEKGEDRMYVWHKWISSFRAAEYQTWIDVIDFACEEASQILDGEKAIEWRFELRMALAAQLEYGRKDDLALEIIKEQKKVVDSMAIVKGGDYKLQGRWFFFMGSFYYRNEDMEQAIEQYKKSMEIYHRLGDHSKDLLVYRSIGSAYAWSKQPELALEYYERADTIKEVDKVTRFQKLYLQYHIGLLHSQNGRHKKADTYFRYVIKNINVFGREITRQRIQLDYFDNLCSLGDVSEALEGFESLKETIYEEQGANMINFTHFYSNCLAAAGRLKEVREINEQFLKSKEEDFKRIRNKEMLEWQAKFETQQKEAKIESLELERENTKARFQLRLALVGLIGLLGVSILSLLLYRNKNRAQQIALQRERDKQIAKARDRLFSSLTHDIRTPLSLMLGPLERVEGKVGDESIRADIHLAQRNGKRLLELFNQILDWNKAEAKALSLNNQLGQLDLMLHELCKRFAQQTMEEGIHFAPKIDVSKGQFYLDYDKLDKILTNLIGNATKFCEPGQQIHFQAGLETNKESVQLKLMVKDNGPGISESDQSNLFQRYYQGEQGKLKGGTGIGLALVKELVDIMGGTLDMQSAENRGTSFHMLLPIREVVETDWESTTDPVAQAPSISLHQTSEKPLILIVEDEPELLSFLKTALRDGYQVEKAGSANIGYSIAVSRLPDIIISDWALPDHNGGWLCREIRENPITSHIPIIVLTAYATASNQKEAFEAGAVAWMTKPFEIGMLQRQIQTILQQQKRLQEQFQRDLAGPVSDNDTGQIDPFLKKVMSCLDDNISDERYSVEKMADQLNLSRAQLFRKLKGLIGYGPNRLLTLYRLEKARKLLAQSGKTIAEIAFEVGFSDPNYFSRVYKKYFKVPPTQDQR